MTSVVVSDKDGELVSEFECEFWAHQQLNAMRDIARVQARRSS